jgi:predicted nucleic acid-binding Zn ribbon protein
MTKVMNMEVSNSCCLTCPDEFLAFVESFNGTFRAEYLDAHWFTTLTETRQIVETWRREYNESRPHTVLGKRTRSEFASQVAASHSGSMAGLHVKTPPPAPGEAGRGATVIERQESSPSQPLRVAPKLKRKVSGSTVGQCEEIRPRKFPDW